MHKMTAEDADPNHAPDDIEDWLQNSASFISSLLDYPYTSGDIGTCSWWNQSEETGHDPIQASPGLNITCNTNTDTNTANLKPPGTPTLSSNSKSSDLPKKRKVSDDAVPKSSQNNHLRKNQIPRVNKEEMDNDRVTVEESVAPVKRSSGNKKGTNKGGGNNGNNNNKDGRWAEQLLNPCATAITAGNTSRVQHFLYVLNELASPTGDANHRLAYHGLRAISHHISSLTSNNSSSGSTGPITFASTEPKLFQKTLFKFNEVSPWFAFPNNIANASIIQILNQEQGQKRDLHIIYIGVSHGMQWPTLLEALTRLPGGPPPVVRITVITAITENDQGNEITFSIGPPGDNFSARLLRFAQSMNINLQINVLASHSLQNLGALINSSPEEILIVCAQFRLHHLNHNSLDESTDFLRSLRSLDPKGVILSENNMDCCCNNCGDFATGFSRRVEYLWRFLDSTSSAFKGRETEERRVMEGEAAKALTTRGEMNEGKEKWCERMRSVGLVGEAFGEDAVDGARALLRKYDSNWEMRPEEKDGCVGLWWKGQPVSFCSLWKSDTERKC